jgi:hypothetical protein
MFKAVIEKVTQNFGVETWNDMKLIVKYVTGKEVDPYHSIRRAVAIRG